MHRMRAVAITSTLALAMAILAATHGPADASVVASAPKPPPMGAFIKKNPVDLTHVVRISRFRSCMGHDYSPGAIPPGSDSLPNKSVEWGRSMKHYITLDLPDTPAGVVQGYAPFTGTVQYNLNGNGPGMGVGVVSSDNQWYLEFQHVDPLVPAGTKVKAGQAVMSWPAKDLAAFNDAKFGPGNHPSTGVFDLSLTSATWKPAIYESVLTHMVPAVAKAWAAKGFAPASAIIGRTYRDEHPCAMTSDNWSFAGIPGPDDYVNAIGYSGP